MVGDRGERVVVHADELAARRPRHRPCPRPRRRSARRRSARARRRARARWSARSPAPRGAARAARPRRRGRGRAAPPRRRARAGPPRCPPRAEHGMGGGAPHEAGVEQPGQAMSSRKRPRPVRRRGSSTRLTRAPRQARGGPGGRPAQGLATRGSTSPASSSSCSIPQLSGFSTMCSQPPRFAALAADLLGQLLGLAEQVELPPVRQVHARERLEIGRRRLRPLALLQARRRSSSRPCSSPRASPPTRP